MATAARNNPNQVERLTRCPICLDKFRLPKVLPCMHTFCLTPCLTSLVDPRARSLRCPECRREHPIPSGGVQAFPANLAMMGFPDLPPPTTIINLPDCCFACKQQKQTLIKCHDCSEFLCSSCREPHLREAFHNISSSVSQLHRALPQLSNRMTSHEQQVDSVRTNYEQIREEITFVIATLIDELKHREAALLADAEGYMQSQLRTFHTQQEAAEVELANIAGFCQSVGTSFPSGQLVNDADLAIIRSQCNRYIQQISTLQSQLPVSVQKLRLVFDTRSAVASSIQNFGQLLDASGVQQQRSQPSTSRATLSRQQQQQSRVSARGQRQTAPNDATGSQNLNNGRAQSQNDQNRHPENVHYSSNSASAGAPRLSQTISYRRTPNHASESVDSPFANLSLTLPPRSTASWDPLAARRSTSNLQSSSVFGDNPFSTTNPRSTQRQPVPSQLPQTSDLSQGRNYVTSTTAARSLEGDDRPIFGGRGNGGGGPGRGRGRSTLFPPIQEHEVATHSLERRDTFVLDEPSLPNLPHSGAQKPRDKVTVRDLYNVRRRKRARTPISFTVNLNEASQSSPQEIMESGTI